MNKFFLPVTVAPTSSDSEGDIYVDTTDCLSSMVLVSNPPSPAEARTPQSQFYLTPQQSPSPSPSTSIRGTPQSQTIRALASSVPRSLNRSRDGKRRRSMSVGNAEQWHRIFGNNSLLPSPSNPPHQREVSGSKTAAAREWENALSGFDGHIASLEIKDPGSSAPASGAPGSGIRAAGQEGRKAEKSLAPNQKASNRERKGSKPDLSPLSLPITGAGGPHKFAEWRSTPQPCSEHQFYGFRPSLGWREWYGLLREPDWLLRSRCQCKRWPRSGKGGSAKSARGHSTRLRVRIGIGRRGKPGAPAVGISAPALRPHCHCARKGP